MRIYSYCFYRLAKMWIRLGFADDYGYRTQKSMNSVFVSSAAMVSLVQLSNVNTLLMIPVMLLHRQFSQNILVCIAVAIVVGNVFVLNARRLFEKCETRWKDEPKAVGAKRKWLVVVFFVLSMAMLFVSGKIVYIPHSLTVPYWGN